MKTRRKKAKVFPFIYNGFTIIGRQGRPCRICYTIGHKILLEFEDGRRDFGFKKELEEINKKFKPVSIF